MDQKVCVNKTQFSEQVVAAIEEYATWENAASCHIFTESRFRFYAFDITSTAICSMMKAELALV